jgi:hypothetical protein
MRERLLDLCLLAYPRARRERDRDYLRDLALDLAETQGVLRQAWSLLAGGLRARIEVPRRAPGAGLRRSVKRIVVACFALAALAFAATGLIVSERGGGAAVSEVDHFVCQYMQEPPSKRQRAPSSGGSGCGETERLIAARKRAGWDCKTQRARSGGSTTTWRCTLGMKAAA